MPVTPDVSGKPVAFVSRPLAGVPSAGVTSVGEVARTTFPVPVEATNDNVHGEVIPVFGRKPVAGSAGSTIIKGVVMAAGASNPTPVAVCAVPADASQKPPMPEPTPLVKPPGVLDR